MTVEPAHQHRESEDPRRRNHCACGALMFEPRDLDFENDMMEAACRGRVDPAPILGAMERRVAISEHGAARLRIGVDWLREGSEEGPDWAAYTLWGIRQNLALLDPESQGRLMRALTNIAEAFNDVEWVRARLKGYEDA